MTIEQEAREREAQELHNVCAEEIGAQSRKDHLHTRDDDCVIRSICRALEQRDAERQAHADFRQRVSDAMEVVKTSLERWEKGHCTYRSIGIDGKTVTFSDFIIPKPVDPLVEAMSEAMCGIPGEDYTQPAADLRTALDARGLAIVKKEAV